MRIIKYPGYENEKDIVYKSTGTIFLTSCPYSMKMYNNVIKVGDYLCLNCVYNLGTYINKKKVKCYHPAVKNSKSDTQLYFRGLI